MYIKCKRQIHLNNGSLNDINEFHTKLFKLVLLERTVLHPSKSRVTFIDVKHMNQN